MLKENFWKETKNQEIPSFKCPTCNEGFLIPDNRTLTEINSERAYSLFNYTLDPADISYKFSIIAKCSNNNCKEGILISGNNQKWENGYLSAFEYETEGNYDFPEGTPKYCDNYVVENITLPINLIELPEEINEEFKDEIIKSFKLFWQDTNSCANKVRIAVEILLTKELKIIKRKKIEDKRKSTPTNKAYKYKSLSLGERIGRIKNEERYSKYKNIAENLKAIKWIGNDGSHSEKVISRQEIQNVYKILEHLLKKIYSADKEIETLTKKINKRKK